MRFGFLYIIYWVFPTGGLYFDFIPTGGLSPFIPTGGLYSRIYSHGRVIFSDLFPREGYIFPTWKTNGIDWGNDFPPSKWGGTMYVNVPGYP